MDARRDDTPAFSRARARSRRRTRTRPAATTLPEGFVMVSLDTPSGRRSIAVPRKALASLVLHAEPG